MLNNEEIVNAISKMNIFELSELVKLIEEKFNISHLSQTAVNQNTDGKTNVIEQVEEKTLFTIIMTSYGDNKLNVIKAVRTILNLGLKEAKDFVEKLPATIKSDISKVEAEKIKDLLETNGAVIDVR